jgi:hypothetical protein
MFAIGRVIVLLVVLTVLLKLLGPPITIFFIARWEAKKIPAVKVTAQPLTDYSVSEAPGKVFSYFGYSFEVPWNASVKTKESPDRSAKSGIVQLKFDSGQNLLLIAPANQTGLLNELVQDQSLHMENLRLIFGDLRNRSAYDQYSALLNTSPSTIRAFGPRPEAVRGVTLLTIKAIALPASLETGAFAFQLPNKRGFQIGDPRKSKRIDLEVLDVNGHYVEIICYSTRGSVKLTQPELNRILTTLHIVSPDSFAAHPITTAGLRN